LRWPYSRCKRFRRNRRPRDPARQSRTIASSATSAARTRITNRQSVTTLPNSTPRPSKARAVATASLVEIPKEHAKRGARRLPFLSCFTESSANLRAFLLCRFARDTHRVRGVISLWFALSPVESYASFRSSLSSQGTVYAPATHKASGNAGGQKRRTALWKRLLYEERFAELVAADERLHCAKAIEEILNFTILVNALRGNQPRRADHL